MNRIKLTIVSIVVLSALGGSYAIAAGSAPKLSQSAGQKLGILQTAERSSDAAAARAFRAIEQLSGKSLGVDDMRLVNAPQGAYYLADGPEQVCVYIRSTTTPNSASCTSHESLAAGDPLIINDGMASGTALRVSALFPDGVQAADLATSGDRQAMSFRANLAVAVVRGKLDRLTWRGADGSLREFKYGS